MLQWCHVLYHTLKSLDPLVLNRKISVEDVEKLLCDHITHTEGVLLETKIISWDDRLDLQMLMEAALRETNQHVTEQTVHRLVWHGTLGYLLILERGLTEKMASFLNQLQCRPDSILQDENLIIILFDAFLLVDEC